MTVHSALAAGRPRRTRPRLLQGPGPSEPALEGHLCPTLPPALESRTEDTSSSERHLRRVSGHIPETAWLPVDN